MMWTVLYAVLLLPSSVLAAQPYRLISSLRAPTLVVPTDTGDTLAERLATITTDTGAFAPGHKEFARYNTPGLCRAAARWTRAVSILGVETQVARFLKTENDTIGAGEAARVARACGAQFTVANTTADNLFDLFDLAVHEQNDSLSLAVLTQIIKHSPTGAERLDHYQYAMRAYLAPSVGHIATAQSLMNQVDALGVSARAVQIALHGQLLLYHASHSQDQSTILQEIARFIDLSKSDSAQSHFVYTHVRIAYSDLMSVAAEEHANTMQDIAQQAKQDLRRYTKRDQVETKFEKYVDWGNLPIDSVVMRLAPTWYSFHPNSGPIAPRLEASTWFPEPGRARSDTVVPVHGKINLICYGAVPFAYYGDASAGMSLRGQWLKGPNLSPQQGALFAAYMKRWLSLYGAAGLVATVVQAAQGYDVDDVSGAAKPNVYHGPNDRASTWEWYYQKYEHLPVTVAIQDQHDRWLSKPDGRLWEKSDMQYQKYIDLTTKHFAEGARSLVRPGACTLIGREGNILYSSTSMLVSDSFGAIDNALKWLMNSPPSLDSARNSHP